MVGEAEYAGFFRDHYRAVATMLHRVLGSAAEAEDLAQEAFLRLFRAISDARPGQEAEMGGIDPGSVGSELEEETAGIATQAPPHTFNRAWLYRVALNLAYNAVRDRGRRRRLGEEMRFDLSPQVPPDPAGGLERKEEREKVRRILASLPEEQARLLLLRHGGLAYREVAQAAGIAPGSVGTLLVRAHAEFARRYRQEVAHDV